jgi:peptidoglycan hydrolase-like protein with peptidoglycan-binding domain
MSIAAVRRSTVAYSAASTGHPTLRLGAKGPSVSDLQRRLNAHGAHLAVDGDFGPRTQAAVLAFQRSHGLAVDGVVGPHTWAALGAGGSGGAGGVSGNPSGPTTRSTGYINGHPFPITLEQIPGGRYLNVKAAEAFKRLYAAARRDGVSLSVNSAFRTNAQQAYLYQLYRQGRGNLAARPGYSNHQQGRAVDLSYSSYAWLARNAAKYGFHRTVPSEAWHWEFLG